MTSQCIRNSNRTVTRNPSYYRAHPFPTTPFDFKPQITNNETTTSPYGFVTVSGYCSPYPDISSYYRVSFHY
ncbi:MAG: hypothetical protein JO297_03715 [Nitrososphaeraceae archaeon]|nr:hypothetical protein [Nitrososphaeraceae archaeon]